MSRLLTTSELCAELGCHEETAYRRAARGEWPAYRIGPEYCWNLAEVLEAMRAEQGRRVAATPTGEAKR
jgi:excisionase family DNA binding protein